MRPKPNGPGIPTPTHHRQPAAHSSPADRVVAKPTKGRQPGQPDYDTTNLRQPKSAGKPGLSPSRKRK
jgi:hypothetical protein